MFFHIILLSRLKINKNILKITLKNYTLRSSTLPDIDEAIVSSLSKALSLCLLTYRGDNFYKRHTASGLCRSNLARRIEDRNRAVSFWWCRVSRPLAQTTPPKVNRRRTPTRRRRANDSTGSAPTSRPKWPQMLVGSTQHQCMDPGNSER